MFGSKNSELTRKYASNWFDGDHLRVHSSSRGRVLQEADRRRTPAPARPATPTQASSSAASTTRPRAAARTAARTARRRRRPARAPCRSRASRATGARRGRRTRPAATRAPGRLGARRLGSPPRSRGHRLRERARRRSRGTAAPAGSPCCPPASTGTRNGSAATASSGSACGRRVKSTASPATAAPPTRRRETALRTSSADRLELLGVRDVADEQHRRQHERGHHERPATPLVAVDQHRGDCQCGRHHAELRHALRYRESRAHSLGIMGATGPDAPARSARGRSRRRRSGRPPRGRSDRRPRPVCGAPRRRRRAGGRRAAAATRARAAGTARTPRRHR